MASKKTTQEKEVKTIEQLREALAVKRQELLEARRGHKQGELANPRVLTATRKEIARSLTAIHAAELSEKETK